MPATFHLLVELLYLIHQHFQLLAPPEVRRSAHFQAEWLSSSVSKRTSSKSTLRHAVQDSRNSPDDQVFDIMLLKGRKHAL